MLKFFYDIPVYRLSDQEYYDRQSSYIDSTLDTLGTRSSHQDNAQADFGLRDHLWKRYGGAWRFNEIVGFVRLHFLGTQVRGEWWRVDSKRITRTRTKRFEYISHNLAPGRRIPVHASSDEIYAVILEYIQQCARQPELKRLHIDTRMFEVIGSHVDWKALIGTGE